MNHVHTVLIMWIFLSFALCQHGYILMVRHDFHPFLKLNLSVHHWVRMITSVLLLSTFFDLSAEILSCFYLLPLLARIRTLKALGLLANIAYLDTQVEEGKRG